ncbi:MAG: hypothetical protein EOO71_06730 [Myxococcaceae bacterium]|nr:MAG: hypothetical protein EOO71_06730 [Myxococcaceae bacterium]
MLESATTTENVQRLVLPVLYVQRHCLEIIIKDLILACFHIDEARSISGDIRVGIKPPDFNHDLVQLAENLEERLGRLQIDARAQITQIQALAKSFSTLENGSPERFRYAYVEKFKEGQAPPFGFPNELFVPIHVLQAGLKETHEACAKIDNPSSLFRKLYEAAGNAITPTLSPKDFRE